MASLDPKRYLLRPLKMKARKEKSCVGWMKALFHKFNQFIHSEQCVLNVNDEVAMRELCGQNDHRWNRIETIFSTDNLLVSIYVCIGWDERKKNEYKASISSISIKFPMVFPTSFSVGRLVLRASILPNFVSIVFRAGFFFIFSVQFRHSVLFSLNSSYALCLDTRRKVFTNTQWSSFPEQKSDKTFSPRSFCVCVCASFDRNLKTNNKTKLNEVNTMNENKILIKNSGWFISGAV